MRLRPSLSLLLPCVLLLGCGSGTSPSSPGSSPISSNYLNLNGDWIVVAAQNLSSPPNFATPVSSFVGDLQSTNGTVTGTLRALDNQPPFTGCVANTQDLQVTGTLSSTGNLSLSTPVAGGTATITATLGSNLQTEAPGSWVITGGACAMPATPTVVAEFLPLTGTFAGTFNVLDSFNYPVPGTATTITATFTQSSTANADAEFPLTGTLVATGACAATISFTGDLVFSDVISATVPTPVFTGAIENFNATTVAATVNSPPACNSQVFHGTLTRQ